MLFIKLLYKLVTHNLLKIVELQDDNKLLEQLVTSQLNNLVASCQQAIDNLSTSCEQLAVRTHPVYKLLEQHCYKSAAGLLQLVRFCMCSKRKHKIEQSITTVTLFYWR
jgi:hypothetical protein